MSSVLGTLGPGHQFEEQSFTIDRQTAVSYARAVGDESPLAVDDQVPPMALIALGLSRVIDALSLDGGTVHASQEVEFGDRVAVGQRICARSVLKANSVRRGARFATVETRFSKESGEAVARAVSMVIAPE